MAQLKARLSSFLEHVRAGQEIVVTDRGRPVARLVPVGATDPGSRRDRLLREGLLLPGRGRVHRSLLEPPASGEGRVVLDALLSERSEGR